MFRRSIRFGCSPVLIRPSSLGRSPMIWIIWLPYSKNDSIIRDLRMSKYCSCVRRITVCRIVSGMKRILFVCEMLLCPIGKGSWVSWTSRKCRLEFCSMLRVKSHRCLRGIWWKKWGSMIFLTWFHKSQSKNKKAQRRTLFHLDSDFSSFVVDKSKY